MTCTLPYHNGTACWTWTCEHGPRCGHGHAATHRERDAKAHEHQARHARDAGVKNPPPPGPEWSDLVKRQKAPTIRLEHHTPTDCPHCRHLPRVDPAFY